MKRAFLTILTSLLVVTVVAAPAVTLAYDPFAGACDQAGASDSTLCADKGSGTDNPLTGKNGLFRGIAGVIATISGVIAVILILIAGLRYVTAGGDAGKIKAAKDTIIAAIAGLVIIVLADSIISFVLSRVIS